MKKHESSDQPLEVSLEDALAWVKAPQSNPQVGILEFELKAFDRLFSEARNSCRKFSYCDCDWAVDCQHKTLDGASVAVTALVNQPEKMPEDPEARVRWFHTVCRNTMVSAYRKNSAEKRDTSKTEPLDEDEAAELAAKESKEKEVESEVEALTQSQTVDGERLSDRQAQLLRMAVVDGDSQAEIARAMNVKPSTVFKWFGKMRPVLQKLFEPVRNKKSFVR